MQRAFSFKRIIETTAPAELQSHASAFGITVRKARTGSGWVIETRDPNEVKRVNKLVELFNSDVE